ncbi:MAG: hypothetical protein GEV05_24340 [Betaproteobacteria bacterium]|nr:hypothetical protein [Betaproteobacteria bacterium]
MMEWIERCLLWMMDHPKLIIAAGGFLTTACLLFGGLGLRLLRAGNKIERRVGDVIGTAPDLLAGIPSWLRIWIPETVMGWVFLVVVAGYGAYLVWLGK